MGFFFATVTASIMTMTSPMPPVQSGLPLEAPEGS